MKKRGFIKKLIRLSPSRKLINDFYVLDVETNGLRAQPDAFRFGVIYGYNFTKVIYTVEEFRKELLLPRYKGKKVFVHNAEFDLNVLYQNIYKLDPKAIYNGKFISATNGNCTFADSMNIYHFSVRKIGEQLGLLKGDIESEYITGKVKKITTEMINYCIRDCEIVYDALMLMFEFCGGIKITIASLSLTYFRSHHLPFDIEHNTYTGKFFWNSYYGGRCEAFYIGRLENPGFIYDINSMYSYGMKKCKFPNPKTLKKVQFIRPDKFIERYLDIYEGCAEITVYHKDSYFGCLPHPDEKGRLCFPVGEFTGWWNFNEIRNGIKHGLIEIKKVHNVVYGQKMESPFIKFVDTLYSLRFAETDNELKKTIYKLIMNSLYGKFAQKIETESEYIEDVTLKSMVNYVNDLQKRNVLVKIDVFNSERKDCFLHIKRQTDFDLSYCIPLFSSYITSFARCMLFDRLIDFHKKGYGVLYCDTDSIFTKMDAPIQQSNKLGKWKKENYQVTGIGGLKNYSVLKDGKEFFKIKGIRQDSKKTGDNTYTYKTLVKSKEALRRNITTGVLTERKKVISGNYTKRIVDKNGETKPLKL